MTMSLPSWRSYVLPLLTARSLLRPRLADARIFFLGDLAGRMSLYSMKRGSGTPEPLLPEHIALRHPRLVRGEPYWVLPALGKILLMLDTDGDEDSVPTLLPIDGGMPTPILEDELAGHRVLLTACDGERNLAYFLAEPKAAKQYRIYRVRLDTIEAECLYAGPYLNMVVGHSDDHGRVLLVETYAPGDAGLFVWERDSGERRLLFGKPHDERGKGDTVSPTCIGPSCFLADEQGVLSLTSHFSDTYGLAYLDTDRPLHAEPVAVTGPLHRGEGELCDILPLQPGRFLLHFNVDGCSFAYEAGLDVRGLTMRVEHTVCGTGRLSGGVLEHVSLDRGSGDLVLSFSCATSPSQIVTVEGRGRNLVRQSREPGSEFPAASLSPGEDASFRSHDGLRVSARLYLPSPRLGLGKSFPVVFYIHGGPQTQERPDFSSFTMPLIQLFTLSGLAVFVPNARGSTGYGLDYMRRVDRDWGGKDRLDHVHAFEMLRADERLDMERVGVMGRSYGGFMTLTLAVRHPDLFKAACQMFGAYDLVALVKKALEPLIAYTHRCIGHPETDRDLLVERSPRTYLDRLSCPLLVIQGENDPRSATEQSRELVAELKAMGKNVDSLVFEDEGHDVTRLDNKIRCFTRIVDFFSLHLSGSAAVRQ